MCKCQLTLNSNHRFNKVDHFKVKLRLPLVYHVGFSIKGEDEVDGEVDGEDGGEDCGEDDGDGNVEVPVPAHTNPYQPILTQTDPYQPIINP